MNKNERKQCAKYRVMTLSAMMMALVLALVGAFSTTDRAYGSADEGGQSGSTGDPGSCDGDEPALRGGPERQVACFNSGTGWLRYTFTGDFVEGILINANKPYNVIKNPKAGHDYDVALMTDSEYTASNGDPYSGTYKIMDGEEEKTYSVRVLSVNDIALGPGSNGNGNWLPIGENTVSGDMDSCRKNGDQEMYRNGLFEGKNQILGLFTTDPYSSYQAPADHTSSNFKSYHNSSAGPTSNSSKLRVGITGKQIPYLFSSNKRKLYRDFFQSRQDVRFVRAGKESTDYSYEMHNWLARNADTEIKNSKKEVLYTGYTVDQGIYYDGVLVMSATSINQAFNIDSKKVLFDYIKFALRTRGEQYVTSENINTVYNAISGTEDSDQDIAILRDSYNSIGDTGDITLNSVAEEVWTRWLLEYTAGGKTTIINTFCYSDNDDSTYTADTIIGTPSNTQEWYTKGSQPYTSDPSDSRIVKQRVNVGDDTYKVKANYYNINRTSGHRPQSFHYGVAVLDLTANGALTKTVNKSRGYTDSNEEFDQEYNIQFGESKNLLVCSFIDYYANYTKEGKLYSNHVDYKFNCVLLSKEVKSSILWSKTSAFAKVGGIQRNNTTADCAPLVMQGNPRGNRATPTVTSQGFSLNATEIPSVQDGRYDWSSASSTGECHVWSQSGTLPSRIIIQTGIQRKDGVHVGDGQDVKPGSDFEINLSGKSYNATTYHYRNFLEQDFSGPLASQLILNAGNTTQFVSVKNATTDVDSEFLFPEQTFSASSTYTHPKIAKDSGSSNDASYKLEGASDVLTSSSNVNFSIVRDGFRCPDRFKYDSAYYYGVYNGRNIASIDYVISDGINNTEYKTGAGGNAYVKPGQGVQFVYNMCAGGTYTHMARTSADTLYGLWTDSSNTHFILSVSDETSDGEDHAAGYLFGKTPFGYNNQSTSATFSTSGNSSNISSSVNFLQIGTNADAQQRDTGVKFNAGFTQYSLRTPYGVNREAAGKYSCNYGDVSDPYYYIIGDGLGGICSKDNSDNYARRKAGWDLGRRFKESITYTNLVYEGGNKVQGPNDVTTSATINTPFNYKTNPTAEIGNIDNSFITAGDSLNVTANFNLDPITNNALSFYNNSAEKTYNTRSKSSLIVSYGFIVSADKKRDFEANYSDLKYVDNPDTGMTLAALCDATFPNNEYCRTTLNKDASYDNKDTLSLGDNNAVDKTKTYILSSDGSDKTEDNVGRAYGWSFNNRVYTIPDEYNDEGQIGDIVCVVSAIYPANSYNLNKDESSISEDDPRMLNGLNGENAGSGAKWAISKPSCTTVSKKPTFSVEGGSLFASGSIDTYTGTYRSKAGNARFDTYMYGSWSEYGIMLGKKNNGMASGAGYGYGSIGGWKIHKPNDHGETYHPVKLSNNECLLATQTVSNTKCGSPDNSYGDGASSEVIKKIQGQLANVMSDLRARYKTNTLENSAGETATPLHNGAIISGNDICTYNPDKDEYRTSDGVTGFCSSKGEQYYTIASSVFEINDDIEFVFNDRNDENASKRNRTIVIRTNGTLKINGNIKIQNDGYSSIKQIPNVLIFAKDIQVSDKVSQIDAWIIAEGTFNTCAYKSSDPSVKYNDESDLHANDCNKSLLINGPVSANKIKLFRTAGAGTTEEDPLKISSYNYVIRAEIFNMTPATYLWARAQAESNSGLITTYVKELPVRY